MAAPTPQQQLDAINTAIAAGLTKVKYHDGSEYTYPTMAELLAAQTQLAAAQAAVSNGGLFVRTGGARFS